MKGKSDLINIIKILAVNCTEILIDIDIESFTINSIELDDDDTIILHSFIDDMDLEFLYDDISTKDQLVIHQTLCSLLYN